MENIKIIDKFSSQKCTSDAVGACAAHFTETTRELAARFAHQVGKRGAQRTALTHRVCIKHTQRAVYPLSAVKGAL